MSYFLGIDLGTSYFKAGIFDQDGRLYGLGRQAAEKDLADGRCEVSVAAFWKALSGCVGQALDGAGLKPDDIRALSYSSQANSFLLLDSQMDPLTPLILWTDSRAVGDAAALRSLTGRSDFTDMTGLGIPLDEHAMVAKIEWIQKNQPEVWKQTAAVMTISDYLVFSLTGRRTSDLSTASMTGLLDVWECGWWKESLDLFGIGGEMLSKPEMSGTSAGKLTLFGAALLGLKPGTELFLGGLDHHMVAVGAGIADHGYVSESTGTVLACVNYAEGYDPRAGINTGQGLDINHYFQMAFSENGATALEWYQKTYVPSSTIPQLVAEAEKVAVGCDGLIALPQSDSYPGLTGFRNADGRHTHAHFARAIQESTAATLVKLVRSLDPDGAAKALVPSGGGAKSRLWLQIKADLLGKNFLVQDSGELAVKGAAMLCAVGCGYFENIGAAIDRQVAFSDTVHPCEADAEAYQKWYKENNN